MFFSRLNIRVGTYLALRQIRRSSLWTTGLIVFVMLLTFLNLVVVTGILVGLVEGISKGYREQYTGDVIVSSLAKNDYIEQTPAVMAFVDSLPQTKSYVARYITGGTIEANYKTRTNQNDKPNLTSAQFAGIDPVAEDKFSTFSQYIVEGRYLEPGDFDQVLLGSQLLAQYSFGDQPGLQTLKNVGVGTKVRIKVAGATREVVVKGIIDSKLAELSMRVYMTDTQLRAIIGRDDYNVAELPIKLQEGTDPVVYRDLLLRSGIGEYAKVQTYEDSIPPGVADITNTFAMLGNMISSVGLVVASITIFIVIFVNALTRRKFIGILKGIGVDGRAIEISYMIQSLFYALLGSGVGLVVLYGFLVPFVAAHPIDFPFSDGILVAPVKDTMVRIVLLVIATIIAGYIPARMIVKKNTLDSILGRN